MATRARKILSNLKPKKIKENIKKVRTRIGENKRKRDILIATDRLKHTLIGERVKALRVLEKHRAKSSLNQVEPLIKGKNPKIAVAAARVLLSCKPTKETAYELMRFLKDTRNNYKTREGIYEIFFDPRNDRAAWRDHVMGFVKELNRDQSFALKARDLYMELANEKSQIGKWALALARHDVMVMTSM